MNVENIVAFAAGVKHKAMPMPMELQAAMRWIKQMQR
jgi:hypothetical protein